MGPPGEDGYVLLGHFTPLEMSLRKALRGNPMSFTFGRRVTRQDNAARTAPKETDEEGLQSLHAAWEEVKED